MASRARDINEFLERRRQHWSRLEALLRACDRSGLNALAPAEVREFGSLYRRASSDLVTARSRTANAEILEYLNDLVARAYAHVYRGKRRHLQDVWVYLSLDFPRLFRRYFRYILAAFLAFMLGAAVAGAATMRDPGAVDRLLPPMFADMWSRDADQRYGEEEDAGGPLSGSGPPLSSLPAMSAFYLTNNSKASLVAFSLGITAGLGTLAFLFYNGMVLGGIGGHTVHEGIALQFVSFVTSHAAIELTAVFIAGGAGLLLGLALVAPGRRSRRDALRERARPAVMLVLGCIPMMGIAGLIEACISPFPMLPLVTKGMISATSVVLLVMYFGYVGRGSQPGNLDDLTRF